MVDVKQGTLAHSTARRWRFGAEPSQSPATTKEGHGDLYETLTRVCMAGNEFMIHHL